MIEFITVPLSVSIRGITYPRGTVLQFDVFHDRKETHYRLWPSRAPPLAKRKFEFFTQKQIDAMQPHWITGQEEFSL